MLRLCFAMTLRKGKMDVKRIDGQGRGVYSLVKPGGVTSTFGENLGTDTVKKEDSRPYPACEIIIANVI